MPFGPFDSEIHPLIAVFRELDTAATAAAGSYNNSFREPFLTDTDDDGIGEPDQQYGSEISIRVQVESDVQEAFSMGQGGDMPRTSITLSVFRERLREAGYLGADGKPTLKKGTRLVRIEDLDGETQWTYDSPDWLYIEQIRFADAHLAGKNNFFLVECKSREEGPRI